MRIPGKLFKKLNSDAVCFLLLTLASPLFFYKLGQNSLVSWDEAWYGDISQNILKTGDLFNLIYNGAAFTDKPPVGFWIEALFFKLFGISELSARLPQALAGLITLYIVYLLGKKLFGRVVGLSSAISLVSAPWFLYRARSGNLDILLTMSFVLTVYFAVLAAEKRKFFLPLAVSLAFLGLVKGIVFLPAVIPALVILFWKNKLYKKWDYVRLFLITGVPTGIWLVIQFLHDPALVIWHFFHSARSSSLENNFLGSLKLYKDYLHNGIGRWFWPGIWGVALGLVLREKRLLILAIFFVAFSVQFLFSQGVQIWHLIPLYPFMILLFYGSVWVFGQKLLPFKQIKILLAAFILGLAGYFSITQTRALWYQFIDIPAYVSDEAILSREASKYPGRIILDGDFDPAGAFYAGRPVVKLYNPDLKYLFENENLFLLITNQWRLDQSVDKNIYEVLKRDRDKVLVRGRM